MVDRGVVVDDGVVDGMVACAVAGVVVVVCVVGIVAVAVVDGLLVLVVAEGWVVVVIAALSTNCEGVGSVDTAEEEGC